MIKLFQNKIIIQNHTKYQILEIYPMINFLQKITLSKFHKSNYKLNHLTLRNLFQL